MSFSAEEIERVYERRYAGFRLGVGAILNDFDAAHDTVQDGFARALVEREKCRGESPEAWIWRIVERTAFDELRRRRGAGSSSSCGTSPISPTPRSRAPAGSEGTVAATLAQAHAELQRRLEPEEAPR